MSNPLELLTGPEAATLLKTALTGLPGGAVPGFRCVVDQVHDRPGAETSVGYDVHYGLPGQEQQDYLVATTAEVPSAAEVQAGETTVRVWRHPADLLLTGLAEACTAGVISSWLPTPPDPQALAREHAETTEMLVYRPLRRAVLRTRRAGETFFTKVVRPDRAEALVRRHELLSGLGPDVVATPVPGVLVTAEVPGETLAVALAAWQLGETDVRPNPADALALLDRLPTEALEFPARPSWTDRVDLHGASAATTLPQHAEEIRAIAREIQDLAERLPVGPLVPTHGDFYEANVFCADGRPQRLIDVDTVGPGRREDDLACMVAHLAVLQDFSPQHYPRGAEVADTWAQAFEQTVHPGAFRTRVAGVLLSLVSGAEPATALARLDLARSWTWRARQAAWPQARGA